MRARQPQPPCREPHPAEATRKLRGLRKTPGWLRLAALAALAAGVALAVANCVRPATPRHSWDEQRGPLVSHETFPADCSLCHYPGDWKTLKEDFTFDHEAETDYALVGAHEKAACLLCHNDRGPVQDYMERGCGGCHVDPHQGGFGKECEKCHQPTTWEPGGLVAEHANTRFPLLGVHAVTPCESCHQRADVGIFSDAPLQCDICHQADLARALVPDHRAQGLTVDCERCHTPLGFRGATFAHTDNFPLTGGHAGVACESCHTSGIYSGLSTDCQNCHLDDYNAQPVHASSGFPTTCADCHDISGFGNVSFAHTSSFPLSGGHGAVACDQCHTSGSFSGLSPDCQNCHMADYTAQPIHASSGFPTTCADCHQISSFADVTFAHTGSFPLTGGHGAATCDQCHSGGTYSGLSQDCETCHMADYQGQASHTSGGYPTTCAQCHQISSFADVSFQHTSFPLTGAHAAQPCSACHTGGVFAGTSSACIDCHLSDYQGAPDHAALSFPTTCQDCHSTSSFANPTFSHTFPLHGPHDKPCSDCHISGTLTTYSCIHHHPHLQSEMQDKHSGVSGFAWESTSCVGCHPNP